MAAIWLAGHPYLGIMHDGRIYAVEALRWLRPGFLDDDILFANAFQGNFTIFPAIYGALAGVVGLHTATVIVYFLGQLLWLTSIVVLISSFVASPKARWILVFAIALLPGEYGSNRIFAYAEAYATPRPFAEGMTILGLALLLAKHRWSAGLALMMGMAFHPLVAWPGVAVAMLFETLRPGPWIWFRRGILIAMALLPIVLAVAGVAPFARLFAQMDLEWFEVVNHRDAYALVGNWTLDEYARPLAATVFILLAGRFLTTDQRRLTFSLLLVAALGFASSLVLGEGLRNLLVINAQLWRAVWLLTVLGNLAAAIVLVRLWPARSQHERWILALYLSAVGVWFFDRFFHVGAMMTLVAGIGAGLAIIAGSRLEGHGPRMFARTLLALPVFTAAVAALASTGSLFFITPALDFDTIFFREFAVMVPALLVLLATWRWPRQPLMGLIGGTLILALAMSIVDHRTDWLRHYAHNDADPVLRDLLPEGHSVFWESGVAFLWLTLQRPSYLSCVQGSASIFNRQLAIVYARRLAPLAAMELEEFQGASVCRPLAGDSVDQEEDPAVLLASACRTLRDLDFLVLRRKIVGVDHRTWRAPVALVEERVRDSGIPRRHVRDFHIYDCARLR